MADTTIPSPCVNQEEFDFDYNICAKGILPSVNIGRFYLNGAELVLDKFEKEDLTNKLAEYIAICDGDSGSGHWVTVKEGTSESSKTHVDDNTRRVLVAVTVSTFTPKYKTPGGKTEKGVCGSLVKSIRGKIEASRTRSISTFYQKTLAFIKKWALICKTYGLGGCTIL